MSDPIELLLELRKENARLREDMASFNRCREFMDAQNETNKKEITRLNSDLKEALLALGEEQFNTDCLRKALNLALKYVPGRAGTRAHIMDVAEGKVKP